jgi:nicotinate phosphoribosyltransferase
MFILCEGYFKIDDRDWVEDHAVIRGESRLALLRLGPFRADSENSMREEQAKQKALRLLLATPSPKGPVTPLAFSEFGTRRRRSYKIHETVMKGLIDGDKEWREEMVKSGKDVVGGLAGTSNVSRLIVHPETERDQRD